MNQEDQKKFISLLEDMEFVKELIMQETIPDVQRLFREHDIRLSEEDVIILGKIVNRTILKEDIVNDEELSEICGGASVPQQKKYSFVRKISEAASASMGVIGGFNSGSGGGGRLSFFRRKHKNNGPGGSGRSLAAKSVFKGIKDIPQSELENMKNFRGWER